MNVLFTPPYRQQIEQTVLSLLNNTQLMTAITAKMLDWSCLTLGALGWGQIQIANSNIITINPNNTRKTWMLQLCDMLDIFYPNDLT